MALGSGQGVDALRIQDAPAGDNVRVDNIPPVGVVWVLAVKKMRERDRFKNQAADQNKSGNEMSAAFVLRSICA